jgi:hypothetical protein
MRPPSAERCRCTECRQWFDAALSARGTQKVCSAECRIKRRRKLARRRRWAHVQEARVDERERKRDWRAKRRLAKDRAPGPSATPVTKPCTEPARDPPAEPVGHAPPSLANDREILGKVLECWDRESARSRATLARRITAILRRSSLEGGTARDAPGARSRAGLGV